ncbi:hypothetical protein ACQ4PT_061052 [Festuca glaucescens]
MSPVLQFAHITCVQAVLDHLRGAGCIDVLDLYIAMGEHFAADLGVFFQFTVFNIDTLDPADLVAIAGGDTLAVHIPVGAAHAAAMPAILRLVKRLGAKVIVVVDRGCDHTELPFVAHLFQAFQSTVFQPVPGPAGRRAVDLAVVPPAELLVVDGRPSKYPDSQTAKLLELIKKVCHHPDQPKLKICSVQDSSDMSISSDDDGIEHQKKSSVKLEEDQSATQADVLLEDPELGMTFDTENDVLEYYKNYAKAKGFGVTRRSSNRDENGELRYLTICCSRHAWLACMSNRQPKSIVTDQAKAIQNAVEKVFPDARYRWCLWHIMKKLPEKLGGYDEYEYIKTAIGKAVYDSLTIKDFEDSWMGMLERYNIADNEWLKGLYENRHRWVPVFVKDAFWAGMSTTQRSESMHAFFDGYVNAKTTLKHFTIQYENALRDKVEKEMLADFNSFNSTIPRITHFDIEKQFQSVYTNSKFKEFQEELTNIMYCDRNFI